MRQLYATSAPFFGPVAVAAAAAAAMAAAAAASALTFALSANAAAQEEEVFCNGDTSKGWPMITILSLAFCAAAACSKV